MSKWVNVECVAKQDVMIEIPDDGTIEDAEQIAVNELVSEYDGFSGAVVSEELVDAYLRHADQTFRI